MRFFEKGKFPEAVCASEFSHELRWVAGMFHWIEEVQSYDQSGWTYMDQIRNVSANVAINGTLESSLAMQVDCILKTGKVKCDVAEDTTELFVEILSAVANFNLPTASPTVTQPTLTPVDTPTAVSANKKLSNDGAPLLFLHEFLLPMILRVLLSFSIFVHLRALWFPQRHFLQSQHPPHRRQ